MAWTFRDHIRAGIVVGGIGLWLIWAVLPGMAAERHFHRYTGADGLSQAVVQAIYQDHIGYLWIGTQAGLNRFDGTSFEIYSIQQGLAHDWINAIAEDHQYRLWLATLGGVSCWDGRRFWNYTTADGLIDDQVTSLVVDAQDHVWCATPRGIGRFDGRRWRSYTTDDGLPAARVNVLLLDDDGRLWAGTSSGLYYLDGDHFAAFQPERLSGTVRCLMQDRQHRLWIGLADRLEVYQNGRFVRAYRRADGLIYGPVTALCADRYGMVWVGTPQGLGTIEGDRMTFLTPAQGLKYDDVRALFEDREGILWIGVMGGLYKFQGRAFTNYGVADGLGSDSVRPIWRDRRGLLWVGTTGGLSRFDGRVWRNFTVEDGLLDNAVMALLEDRRGRLWIGTRKGLTIFDGHRFITDPSLGAYGRVVSIVEDRAGTIWCAVQPGGLFRRMHGHFQPVHVPHQSFSNARLLVDRRGWLWVSGDHGLSRWDGRGWRTYTTDDGLADNQPYFLCEDRQGHIWFGYHSSRGFTRFDGRRFQHYTTAQGLTNDAVYSLGVDHEGNLWIGTARGVDRFDGQTFTNYGTEEGYADNESNAGGFFADWDGTLWFGTMGGLSHYNPRFDLTRGDPPTVQFTTLRLGDRLCVPDTSPTLGYRQNDLMVRVAALSFVNPKRLDLQYRLLGWKETWAPLDGRELRITNLPPRTYRLEIRARKYQGPWSEAAHFNFTIRAPFWQRTWFWLLLVGLCSVSIYAAHRFQTDRVRRRAEILEQKVAERTRELAEKTEELESFIYTVSHDLKAPVISLQGLTSLLQLELGETVNAEVALYLERIHANTLRMQRLIGELLELSRIGRRPHPRQPVNMKDLLDEVLAELQGQIQLQRATITVAPALPTVVCERERLQQVWSNLITNALHYSRPGIPPRIDIGAQATETGEYAFFIRDNGVGIAEDQREKIFEIFYRIEGKYHDEESTGVGLAIVKRIIQAHGGRVWVESEGVGRGSTFWFTLPGHSDTMSAASGQCSPNGRKGDET